MKRQKIKPKYKLHTIEQKKVINAQNITNKIINKIKKSFITLGLILLLLFWGIIPVIILAIIKIDSSKLNETTKIIISMINDSALILLLTGIYWNTIKKDFLNFFNHKFLKHLKTALQYWACGIIIMYISNIIISIITNGQLATNEETVRSLIDTLPWYMAFQLIIYAPLTEELIFRKSIKDIFHHKYLYVLTSSLVFGGLHVLSSLDAPIDLLYLIPYCSLGFAFALLYYKTDNIFSTITMHAVHNSLALILYLTAL